MGAAMRLHQPDADLQGYEDVVRTLAGDLSAIGQARHADADGRNWQMAEQYVTGFRRLALLRYGRAPSGREENRFTREINKDIRAQDGYCGPGGSWLSDALRLHRTWPEVFLSGQKQSTYDSYRRVVASSLDGTKKAELKRWLERKSRTRDEVLQRLREEVDAEKGVRRPDFDLKIGNCWRFSDRTQPGGFDGGIHPDLVANLLHYFTDPGDTVLDPTAGGDTVYRVLRKYRYFRQRLEALPHSGPRSVLRFDLRPQSRGIGRADIRLRLPVADGGTDFCLLDPPYYKTANGKYESWSETISGWRDFLNRAVANCARAVRAGGKLALVTDDYLRSKEFAPLAGIAFRVCEDAGLLPVATIYNTYPHFVVTMGPLEMQRCKNARLMVNQTKVIHVFEKS
jgi:hypothetical protein